MGGKHPHQTLAQFRRKFGIDAKLIVVGMTATEFNIADPSDPGMLDVVGFDSAVPSPITGFARWSYGALANALGCSRALVALVLKRADGTGSATINEDAGGGNPGHR
nr:hypothetical protein [Phytoactinopolyspora alkaliphila]